MKARYFIILAGFLAAAAAAVTHANATTAQQQVAAITAADVAGQDTAVLRQGLTQYIGTHMGTTTTVSLDASYQRAVTAAHAAAAGGEAQGQVYAQAQAACAGRNDSIVQAKCVAAYVGSHASPASQPQPVAAPILASYQYHYAAPWWSSDLAGGLWLGTLVALVAALVIWLRHGTRRRRHHSSYL